MYIHVAVENEVNAWIGGANNKRHNARVVQPEAQTHDCDYNSAPRHAGCSEVLGEEEGKLLGVRVTCVEDG